MADSPKAHVTGLKPRAFSRGYRWAGYALGFSIGGFFDGILPHQVLQWHHLLAGLNGGRFDDVRFQILADGLFHAIMYFVAGVGLWLFWRSRRESVLAGADRLLVANALIGHRRGRTVRSPSLCSGREQTRRRRWQPSPA